MMMRQRPAEAPPIFSISSYAAASSAPPGCRRQRDCQRRRLRLPCTLLPATSLLLAVRQRHAAAAITPAAESDAAADALRRRA